jgi:gas vesicle protein
MKTIKYILSIGIAAGAGMALGILTAPRSGKRTRARIKDEFEDHKSAIEDTANKKLKEAKKVLSNSVDKQLKNGKSIIDNAKKELTL